MTPASDPSPIKKASSQSPFRSPFPSSPSHASAGQDCARHESAGQGAAGQNAARHNAAEPDAGQLDPADRALIRATQGGLPICREPYRAVADALGMTEAEVIARLEAMQATGLIRRLGAVPNHYALGYVANGMTVWDVDDTVVDEVGTWLGSQPDVTHCYRRPRHPPDWPYNLFAMLHHQNRNAVRERLAALAETIDARFPGARHAHDVLFSSAILKKTGLRL